MGTRKLFHKIKMGFVRRGEVSIPYVSSIKRYGNYGEDEFVSALKTYLPKCKIKRNVVIDTDDGNAEIDCLILYYNKLFAIEVKSWKGRLIETEKGIIQEKTDRWTGEIHSKYLKSPFKQLNRAIYLLRKQVAGSVWINGVIFFEDSEFEGAQTLSNNVFFSNISDLIDYIKNEGRSSFSENAIKFFNKCAAADYLYAKKRDKSFHCIIEDSSLRFQTLKGEITREKIRFIHVKHHWSYDDLIITLKDGTVCNMTQENAKVKVNDNGSLREYAMCKLDYIELGDIV